MVNELTELARSYLGGKALSFEEADRLWTGLKAADDLCEARRVLERMRSGQGLIDGLPDDVEVHKYLCRQQAHLTSKDRELPASRRHDRALKILSDYFGALDSPALDMDTETLGVAGGIFKRRWSDLGRFEDLRRAAKFYERGAKNDVGYDAYPHINAAFIGDLLAGAGDDAAKRRADADELRELILKKLPAPATVPAQKLWFNVATRAEALFGLRRYADATVAVRACLVKPEPWQLETTTRQLATIAHLHERQPLDNPEIRAFFDALLPGAVCAARSAVIGKVGLALSGGGFRASLYHLGVLARLAELNVLKHVDVLSCVSGGSIVGAAYWLALRKRLLQPAPMTHEDYVALVQNLITRFVTGVAGDLRRAVQPGRAAVAWRALVKNEHGALDPEATAAAMHDLFYRALLDDVPDGCMHELPFKPGDHDETLTHASEFHPGRHNWLRDNKVPVLVLNATTVNTGHAWQFTPTWMGESPWAVHDEADSVRRLQWSWYASDAGWKMQLSRAVAASACVPGIFAPLQIRDAYKDDVHVQLVDGGVHDNQGTVSLLALDCNVLLVSDACGQLMLEKDSSLSGLLGYANRSMSTLMERIRLANFADLSARVRSGLLRGLMFLHMKAGLDAEPIHLKFSQESFSIQREPLSPSGVRKDFQQELAELRTDLDAFSPDETNALMACGYQMASYSFTRDLRQIKELSSKPIAGNWPFAAMLREITSTAPTTPDRARLLQAFKDGKKVRL